MFKKKLCFLIRDKKNIFNLNILTYKNKIFWVNSCDRT
jgi:hypothetical protein